jgi:N-acetylmuramoyl-L-alanine amidase
MGGEAMRMCIDVGHGRSTGCRNSNFREDDWALWFSVRLEAFLRETQPDIECVLTRHFEDELPTHAQRAKIAKDFGADFAVCIHVNSTSDSREHGPLVFRLPGTIYTKEASEVWAAALKDMGGEYVSDNQIRPMLSHTHFASANESDWTHRAFNCLDPFQDVGVSAILLEFGYISNSWELQKLQSEEQIEKYLQATGAAIAVVSGMVSAVNC